MSLAPPTLSCSPEDDLRVEYALSAMLGIETVLETLPGNAQLPAREVLGLVRAVNDAARDVILWLPRAAANDNPG